MIYAIQRITPTVFTHPFFFVKMTFLFVCFLLAFSKLVAAVYMSER